MKDVSTRLIKPTMATIDIGEVLEMRRRWEPSFEYDGAIIVHDEGIAQYSICDYQSHLRYYVALTMSKPSLRCTIVSQEPDNLLEQQHNATFHLVSWSGSITTQSLIIVCIDWSRIMQ